MNSTRHRLSTEPVVVPAPFNLEMDSAELLERGGNWFAAGEKYLEVAERMLSGVGIEPLNRTKLFIRAATCFDIAGQARAAAQAYSSAAAELEIAGSEFRSAGELLNRAGLLFVSVGEYFCAGNCWRRAALAFASTSEALLSGLDSIFPVPSSAGKFTVAANCYTSAGDAFLLANDNEMWSCGAYWEAGRAHSMQGHGYHAFVAYRKALTSVARLYGTHNREELRRILPLTEEERESKLDPLMLM
jgi:tetratricopeptide (TPR) repeat protein